MNGLAARLMALAARLAPRERAEWIEAMRAESAHVPGHRALQFAAGCLWASMRARAASATFVEHAGRQLLVGGALGWAAINLWFAGRASAAELGVVETGAYVIAAIFVLGAVATARFGPRATIALGAPLAVLIGAAIIALWSKGAPLPSHKLQLALLIEDLAVLAVALAFAFAMPRLAERLRQR